jgi:hypothetical protein
MVFCSGQGHAARISGGKHTARGPAGKGSRAEAPDPANGLPNRKFHLLIL